MTGAIITGEDGGSCFPINRGEAGGGPCRSGVGGGGPCYPTYRGVGGDGSCATVITV